ncbi:hypothetical protein AMR95_08755 [Bacillus sp. G1(2015b)]|nr:hypothetical protein AMR95_08755 [Bacillus sp. G1(2015b)]
MRFSNKFTGILTFQEEIAQLKQELEIILNVNTKLIQERNQYRIQIHKFLDRIFLLPKIRSGKCNPL